AHEVGEQRPEPSDGRPRSRLSHPLRIAGRVGPPRTRVHVGAPRHTGSMIGFLVAGLIIGALARLLKPGKQNLGILATLGLGLVGSLIGGTIAWLLGTGSIWELNVLGFVLAIVASVLLIGTAEAITGGKG